MALSFAHLIEFFTGGAANQRRDLPLINVRGYLSNIRAYPEERSFVIRQMREIERHLAQLCIHYGIAIQSCTGRHDAVVPSTKPLADLVLSWVDVMQSIIEAENYGEAHHCVALVLDRLGIELCAGSTAASGPPVPTATAVFTLDASAYDTLARGPAPPEIESQDTDWEFLL